MIQGIDLAYLNPDDPDDRRFLILADHPELQDAIENEIREIELHGQIMNPELPGKLEDIELSQSRIDAAIEELPRVPAMT